MGILTVLMFGGVGAFATTTSVSVIFGSLLGLGVRRKSHPFFLCLSWAMGAGALVLRLLLHCNTMLICIKR